VTSSASFEVSRDDGQEFASRQVFYFAPAEQTPCASEFGMREPTFATLVKLQPGQDMMGIELEYATVEDMVAELERRGITAAIVVSHVTVGQHQPGSQSPPGRREKVYGDTTLELHAAYKAAFLCRAVQWCLDEARQKNYANEQLALELSISMKAFQRELRLLLPG
jgi:hypothetical protein